MRSGDYSVVGESQYIALFKQISTIVFVEKHIQLETKNWDNNKKNWTSRQQENGRVEHHLYN